MKMNPLCATGLALVVLLYASGSAFGWSFAVCGDSRNDKHGILRKILAEVEKSPMEFLIHTGDLEYAGGEKPWTEFKEKTKGFSKPLYYAIGNHELHGGGTREGFVRFFGLPGTNYGFDHRDAHVAILDTGNWKLADNAIDWLDHDLATHPKGKNGIRHLIVAMHVPPRTDNISPHGTPDNYDAISAHLQGVLKRHGVSLVLCSHEHMHQVDDWNGIKVIVSGGAGAPMMFFQQYGYYEIDLTGDVPREIFHAVKP
ncbi:MAG TPA: metallophosphoesterase [Candidatus Deferrimicrobiaceae bacterium]|jgi:3',5'-cyclic AMP phosphodiesterase CpdA